MNLIEKLGDQSIILYQLFFISNYMNFKNQYSLIMFIAVMINIFINMGLKYNLVKIMKPYNHQLPLLGKFCRPLDTKCEKTTVFNYGMPSGHSQIASFIPAIYYFLYKDFDTFSNGKFITMVSIGFFIMTTRYTSKMHTIQQIIMGGLTGILIGYIFSKFFKYFV